MCIQALSLATKGMICCGETIQRFNIPLHINLDLLQTQLSRLKLVNPIINIKALQQTLSVQKNQFTLNLKNTTTFKILSIHC
jgi:hypothetical protein